MVLYEKIRNGGKVCETCTGYVRCKRNSGEMCSSNYRKFQDQGRTAPGIKCQVRSVCCDYGRLTDEVRRESSWTMLFADDIVICKNAREKWS